MGSMDGKIVLVTGATSGIGYYTAREIARMGAWVIVHGRTQEKCLSAVRSIRAETGSERLSSLVADLSSQAQIREAAQNFNENHEHLDVLVNNAGAFFLFRRLSVDGIEMTFAVNHLAYFLLTNLLLDALKASSSARVVNVSSGSHLGQQLDFDDLQLKRFYRPMQAYGRSKLANILFTYELSRRLEGSHITSNALTPGMVATDIWKKVVPWMNPLITPVMERIGQPPLQGAQTGIYLATSAEVEGVNGRYFAHEHEVRSSPESYDQEAAKRLWKVSSQMVGLTEGENEAENPIRG
jgi:NAD(P)-dependent dehydrogenase (short-subunit alcohol dehydrogenase family)